MSQPDLSPSLEQQLSTSERDRARDQGRFTQYGMRIDARPPGPDHANPGTGDHARRFGAGGDPASYANRPGGQDVPSDVGSDAPAHPGTP